MKTFTVPIAWGACFGLARTLIALGTAGTLTFSSTDTLFSPVLNHPTAPYCDGVKAVGAFCVVPDGRLTLTKWVCVLVLLIIASGWRPRITALPHWYIAFSFYSSSSIPDGGDQVAAVLTLLLLPVALTDPRRWHWSPTPTIGPRAAVVCAAVATFLARLQIAGLYFQASVAKLSHQEWADGTAMYYWGSDVSFGAPDWLSPLMHALTDFPPTVVLLTWVPLATEFALSLALLLPPRTRPWLMGAGLALHLGIAVVMGLWSFAFVMFGAILLLCPPIGTDFRLRRTRPPSDTTVVVTHAERQPDRRLPAEPSRPRSSSEELDQRASP